MVEETRVHRKTLIKDGQPLPGHMPVLGIDTLQ